jgi:hypothetical protein
MHFLLLFILYIFELKSILLIQNIIIKLIIKLFLDKPLLIHA